MRTGYVNKVNTTPNYGMRFRLSEKTIKSIETSTGLTYQEMTELSLSESEKLMKDRGTLKEPNALQKWFSKKYKHFGEKMGWLEKPYNF